MVSTNLNWSVFTKSVECDSDKICLVQLFCAISFRPIDVNDSQWLIRHGRWTCLVSLWHGENLASELDLVFKIWWIRIPQILELIDCRYEVKRLALHSVVPMHLKFVLLCKVYYIPCPSCSVLLFSSSGCKVGPKIRT